MKRSAVVLAGGSSSRIGVDKGIMELAGKPLLGHVIDAIRDSVEEIIVVTNSQDRISKYSCLGFGHVRFAVDRSNIQSPLIGALSGFNVAKGDYCLLVPFDTPFISKQVVSLLFELCLGKAAAIPKWPNGNIEPLHAVYRTTVAKESAETAVSEGRLDMRGMIEKMRGVRYVSTLVLQQLDPAHKTFFNINTQADFQTATKMAKKPKMG
ncbi:TPA: molybdenum cofactor guanylyltransferase [Candidatus Bathyarchaeota archaeon]|nr:molybdenum cofactor guanylyltransferase [Candidatus Bathyarchaeota archaeon]HIJ08696.1 molybdenum cofactor guanylyltransferase [Candidatus Bathyarchaeota archaeon]